MTSTNQNTNQILMVRPKSFGFNEETAESNAFQKRDEGVDPEAIKLKAVKEFDDMVAKLESHGIDVLVIEDSEHPPKPDAVFPNNWLSTQRGGTLFTFPMESQSRRAEYRPNILDRIGEVYEVNATFDFSDRADDDIFLEGTGSMIMDHDHKIIYACTSPRTNEKLLRQFAKLSGYTCNVFQSVDEKEQAIYHTNVVMGLGAKYVVICLETVKNPAQRRALIESFRATDKDIVEITLEQMGNFAGNVIELKGKNDQPYLIMSAKATADLTPDQFKRIERHAKILDFSIPTIERYGGGSVRCMIAELFLDKR